MKRLISILLVLGLLLSVSLPSTAFAAERPEKYQNPFYSGEAVARPEYPAEESSLDAVAEDYMPDSKTAVYENKTYYTMGRQLADLLRKKLDARASSVTVRYLSKSELFNLLAVRTKVLNPLFVDATEHLLSTTCTDGDYVRWAVSYLAAVKMTKETKQGGYYYYTLTFDFDYYDTSEQEEQVDRAVDKFIAAIKPNGKSDYEIIKAVHDRLCKMNVYAYEALEGTAGHEYAFSPYGALVKGRCVCQGYAAAFYRICKEMGYDVRFVSSNPSLGCHAWNLINLDGNYYFVDCTWDDQAMDEKLEQITPYTFFLVTYGESKKYDGVSFSILGAHELDSRYYSNRYFDENYTANFATDNYDKTAAGKLSNCKITLSADTFTYDGKAKQPSVTVKAADGTLLTAKTDYTVTYGSNTATGEGTVSIKGQGAYSKKSAQRRLTVLPKAVKNLKCVVGIQTVRLRWTAAGGAVSGYEIQRYVGGKWKHYMDTNTNVQTLSQLSAGTQYRFRVRAYTAIGKRRIYGDFSNELLEYTKPKKGAVTSLTAKSKAMIIKWQAAKGTGYQIQYSPNKDMSNAKTFYIKDGRLAKTVSKLKSKKRYYVRVRSFVKYTDAAGNVKKVYGAWSAKKSVVIK